MNHLFEREPKEIKKSKKSSIILGIVLILILIGFWFFYQIYLLNSPGEEVIFNIKKGEGMRDISSNLKKAGLIKSEILFNFAVILKGVQGNLQAGIYSLSPSMSISEILEKIDAGEIAKESITSIEGWN